MPKQSRKLPQGEKYNKLTVISLSHVDIKGSEFYLCRCDCGNTVIVRKSHLMNGLTKSCGCLRTGDYNTKHNCSRTRLYSIYQQMKDKCINKNSTRYLGIQMQKDWADDFSNFKKWADETGYTDNYFLSRKNITDGYNADNCYWTKERFKMNKVKLYEYKGEKLTLKQISKKYNIQYNTLQARMKNGLSIEQTIEFDEKKGNELYFGEKYGKLTVLGIAPIGREFGKNSYTCECSCGNICIRKFTDIINNRKTACDKCLEYK